ncbi:DUF748 domain-containing protein [bacterium]|nr:MAG: DUF748 domain-containing protein [bacterium]
MKKLIIISLILLGILSFGVIYLNKVVLPAKVKSMLVETIEKQTGKKVILKSLEFNIFKGFVLRDLVILDNQQVILSARQTNCVVFFWPIFRKQIIIPSINIRSPYIFLERRKDNTLNLQDLFATPAPAANEPGPKGPESKKSAPKKSGFSVSVYKISISSGNMVFQDDTLPVKFTKEINNIQLNLQLKLPLALGFAFKGELAAEPVIAISAKGEYRIPTRQLIADLSVKNLAPRQFQPYYEDSGLNLVSGIVDLRAQIDLKEKFLHAQIDGRGDNLVLEKDKLRIKFNPVLKTSIDYDQQAKKFKFDGYCDIEHAGISGLEFLGEVKELAGRVVFNQDSLSAKSLKADLLGMPFELNLTVKDFKTPALNISTDLNLSFMPAIAKEKFNFTYINSAQGKAVLTIKIYPEGKDFWQVQGSANITGGVLKLGKQDVVVENISGNMDFSRLGISWTDAKFKYQGIDYQASGKLSDFSSPVVEMKLFAKDLSLAANFDIAGKKITVGSVKGKYFDSGFSASGNIDNSDSSKLQVDLIGTIDLRLGDLAKIADKRYPAIKLMRPAGRMEAQFSIAGNAHDLKNCFIQARLNSKNLSLYGLNSQGFSLDYLQEQKLAKIISSRVSLYDGVIEATGIMNMDTANLPYHLEIQASGIKLDKLKNDTPARNKNLSGTLEGMIKLNGFSADLDKLSGSGSLQVKDGRLWELNFFQGIGKLLFADDFANIVLSECSAAFLVKNRFVYTDSLRLKSNIMDLSGPLKIGFDGSLEAALDVEIKNDMVPLSGTLKDIATVIVGQAGKFGVIKLSGSLQSPKYVFKPAVADIIKGLTDTFFGKGK